MIGGDQNRLSELLYASHTLGGSQNRLSELHLAVVKTNLFNFYKPPTRLAVFKTDSYMVAVLSELLQASYTLYGRQNKLSKKSPKRLAE